MVIAVGGCDNVDWGGIKIAVVPPPARTDDAAGAAPERDLPAGPILFYVHQDSSGPTVIPVGHVTDGGLAPITPGDDPAAFAARFTDAFLAPGTELALFRRAQRVGTLTVQGATVPEEPVCRPLPRATGSMELATNAGGVTEFLAMDTGAAPESQSFDDLQPARGMQVVGDMLAGRMLQERETAVPSVAAARRQLQPFPLAGSADPGFTATYLVDDSLGVGGDDDGAALFVVFTPRGQSGYQPAFVGFTDYSSGKAAPRVIDFLDWNRDGQVELLLEVFGAHTSWFRAVGRDDDDAWRGIFEDRCDPRTAQVAADTADVPAEGEAATQASGRTSTPTRRARPTRDLDPMPDVQPTIQLSNPLQTPIVAPAQIRDSTGRDTVPPDSGGVAGGA
jgi:hypothetical protein